MPLTDAQCRKAKTDAAPLKLADEKGLYLYVTASGLRSWRLKYRFGGKEKKLTFGPYPEVSLAEAREHRDDARRALREHRDPAIERRARIAAAQAGPEHTFETVALRWHEQTKGTWSLRHSEDVIDSLRRDVFPEIGALGIREIAAPRVLEVLRSIEDRPAIETAKRIRQRMSAVFLFAIGEGIATDNPAQTVRDALRPVRRGKQPAVTDLDEARLVLARAEAEPAHPVTKLGLRLLALTAVRPGELRGARWAEFEDADSPRRSIDWSGGFVGPRRIVWRIPAARMKGNITRKEETGGDHLVPLTVQALDVLEAAHALSGRGPLPFPNARHSHKPMSENALGYLLNRAGYHQRHVPHGWRATFSTVMNTRFKADTDVIELMLAHVPHNKVKAAYDRAAHMERRRELAQRWADLICEGRPAAAAMMLGARR